MHGIYEQFYAYTNVTHHVLNGEQGVYVHGIPPPVVGAVDVIIGGRLEYWIIVEPLHCYLHYTEHKQIRCCKPATCRPSTVLDSEMCHAACRQLNGIPNFRLSYCCCLMGCATMLLSNYCRFEGFWCLSSWTVWPWRWSNYNPSVKVRKYSPNGSFLYPRLLESSQTLTWEPQILQLGDWPIAYRDGEDDRGPQVCQWDLKEATI